MGECRTRFEEIEEGVVVPAPARLRGGGPDFGEVPGLDGEARADPEELKRQVIIEQWGPILRLVESGKPSDRWSQGDDLG